MIDPHPNSRADSAFAWCVGVRGRAHRWVLQPKRLVQHPDPATRLYYGHFNTTMCEYVSSGFDDDARRAGRFGKPAADSANGA